MNYKSAQFNLEGKTKIMRLLPEHSVRCRSLHSMQPHLHSRDVESCSCLLGQHRCLDNLLLFRPHHERWTFCHHPDHFLQTTAQGDQKMPADPPEDKTVIKFSSIQLESKAQKCIHYKSMAIY